VFGGLRHSQSSRVGQSIRPGAVDELIQINRARSWPSPRSSRQWPVTRDDADTFWQYAL